MGRELLAGAAVRRAGVTGAGVFLDSAADAMVRQVLFDDVVRTWQIVVPSFGIIQGPFHIASLQYRGDHASEVTFGTHHQGGPGIAHGGIVAAALDEACGLLATWHRFPTVTARFSVRYRRPAAINRPLGISARVVA